VNPGETSLPDVVVGSSYFAQVSPAGTGKAPYYLQFSGLLPAGVTATIINNQSSNVVLRVASTGTNLTQ
jgi:hypothetical protein